MGGKLTTPVHAQGTPRDTRVVTSRATTSSAIGNLDEGQATQTATFDIPAGASYSSVLDIVQHGRPVVQLLTIPEGMPSVLVQEKLAAIPELTGPVPEITEGSVLPSSYDWRRGETRRMVTERMQAAMGTTLDQLWAGKKGDCPVATKQEAVTLASIVEKETGKAEERRTIAGVYCNRLKIGMPMQCDPTVIYALMLAGRWNGNLRRDDLQLDSPYNTYRYPGLPPGPIASPGRASLEAAVRPADVPYLYFVSRNDGTHVFASTLAEHNQNVARWQLRR